MYAGFEDFVEEVDGADVVGRHDEVVVEEEFLACVFGDDFVLGAAVLCTGSSVCGGVVGVERHAAASGLGDAEGSVGEGFDLDRATGRAAQIIGDDLLADLADHGEVELSSEYDAITELGVEFERLVVGDGELGREVDFEAELAGFEDASHVGGDDSIDFLFGGFFEQGEAELEVVIVEKGVEREVAADAGGVAAAHDFFQVLKVEGAAGTGPHIELGEAEVDGVGSGIDGSL